MKIRYTITLQNVCLDSEEDKEQLDREYYGNGRESFQEELKDFLEQCDYSYCCNPKIQVEDEECIRINDMNKIRKLTANIDAFKLSPEDVLIVRFDTLLGPMKINELMRVVKDSFPDNRIVGIPNQSVDLSIDSIDNTIQYLQDLKKQARH